MPELASSPCPADVLSPSLRCAVPPPRPLRASTPSSLSPAGYRLLSGALAVKSASSTAENFIPGRVRLTVDLTPPSIMQVRTCPGRAGAASYFG